MAPERENGEKRESPELEDRRKEGGELEEELDRRNGD